LNIGLGEIRGAGIQIKKDNIMERLDTRPACEDVAVFRQEMAGVHPLVKDRGLFVQKSMCIGLNRGVRIIDGSAIIQSPTPMQESIVNHITLALGS
jgi:hypothetical protein